MPEIYFDIPDRWYWKLFCDMMDGIIEVIPSEEDEE